MSCGSKDIKNCLLSHVLILIIMSHIWSIMGWLKIQELEYLENRTLIFYEIRKFFVPQMPHFEKLSFCSNF